MRGTASRRGTEMALSASTGMERIFLAVIVSGLLVLVTAMSSLVLPSDATATLVRPLPANIAARAEFKSASERTTALNVRDRR
jgi:hypothetical protein